MLPSSPDPLSEAAADIPMIAIPARRSIFGWMLAFVVCVWLSLFIVHVRGVGFEGSPQLLIGLGMACLCLGWLFLGQHIVLTVGDGFLTVPSWFGSTKIPVGVIQSAKVIRISADIFLEVCLREVPETLRPRLNTFWKRKMLRALNHISYSPPSEPYLFISVMLPDCDDATLMRIIEGQRGRLCSATTAAQE